MTSRHVIGLRIDTMQMDEALRELEGFMVSKPGASVHLCNAWTAVLAAKDEEYGALFEKSSLNLADGMAMVWATRLLGAATMRDRVYGPTLMEKTMERGVEWGARHYLYGGGEGVADLLAARLSERFPDLQIAGVETPPFRPLTAEEEESFVRKISDTGAHFVWVGLGTPKQDVFVERFRGRVDCGALLAVGAAFDFLSGTKKQAPRWIQRSGLEWAFRLLSEPRRLWRRYLVGNTAFLMRFALQLLTKNRRPRAA